MKGTLVASRYATSLLELALENNLLDKVNEDMVELSAVCAESKDFADLLSNPIVHESKKIDIFKALFSDNMQTLSISFLELITKHSREGILPAIAASYTELYKKHNNIVDVVLTSAIELDAATKEKIISKIKTITTGKIELVEKIDPSIIGGFIINIEDKQIDSSVASKFSNLKNILLN
ncbi:ATP synthase F1 subunit delta [Putridiphycobacter roseus]|uniref:ATP synthase subunit delta n=1 Tax=Putridiphycobacter roseus TaxID=2219161 RepID=A0A2W1NPV7_9FLAO|nr:ATP synthase F1 subunit delta [Putridiphycobacter roseus]PZE16658.1 ATP synthase F1 subunit delta [Putridiphycobacter roseus]